MAEEQAKEDPCDGQSTSSPSTSALSVHLSDTVEINPSKLKEMLKTRRLLLKKKKELEEREVDFDDEEREEANYNNELRVNKALLKIERKLHKAGLLKNVIDSNLPILDKSLRKKIYISGTGHPMVDKRISAAMQKKMESSKSYAINCFLDSSEIIKILKSIREEKLKENPKTDFPKPKTGQFDDLVDSVTREIKKAIVQYRYGDHEKNLDSYLSQEEIKKLGEESEPVLKTISLKQAFAAIDVQQRDNEEIESLDDEEVLESGSDEEAESEYDEVEGSEKEDELEEDDESEGTNINSALQALAADCFSNLADEYQTKSPLSNKSKEPHIPTITTNNAASSSTKKSSPALNAAEMPSNIVGTTGASTSQLPEKDTDEIECLGFYNKNGDQISENWSLSEPAELNKLKRKANPVNTKHKKQKNMLPEKGMAMKKSSKDDLPSHLPHTKEEEEAETAHEQHKLKPDWLKGDSANDLAHCFNEHAKEEEIQVFHISEAAEYEDCPVNYSSETKKQTAAWVTNLIEPGIKGYDYRDEAIAYEDSLRELDNCIYSKKHPTPKSGHRNCTSKGRKRSYIANRPY